MRKYILLITGISALWACGNAGNENTQAEDPSSMYVAEHEKGLMEKANTFFKALPDSAITNDNVLTKEKISLGKALYLDARLSKDGKNSCAHCHSLTSYGVDNKQFSEGDLGGLGDRNSPSSFNAALHSSQFWDGRAGTIEEQAGMPILNPVEMNIPNEQFLVDRLKDIDAYKVLFGLAFPDDTDPITYKNLTYAIGAFERTLLTPSKFDDYLSGNEAALSSEEKKGLYDFIETGCITCHSGVVLGGNMLQKFGVYGNYWELTGSEHIDEGRFKVTGIESDKYMFKVPSLRNVEKTGPYFHDGSVNTLPEAVKIIAKLQLNKDLDDEKIKSIEAFLNTLTGEVPSLKKNESKYHGGGVNTLPEDTES